MARDGLYLQVHGHWLRQDWVLSDLIQVVEPQQDAAKVSLGLAGMPLENVKEVVRTPASQP